MAFLSNSRHVAALVLVLGFLFNEWAFRFIFPLQPIDSFLRLMTLVLDGFILVFGISFLVKNQSFGERLKNLISTRPKLLSIYFGSFFAFCLLMLVEFSCRYYFKHVYQPVYAEETYWEPSAIVRDSILGSSLPRDTVISHAYVVNDSLIYKQLYRTDGYSRRVTNPNHSDSTYNQFIMVTGCSYAFGYGLDENQTLSHYLDSITGYRGYNYGISGHGTQQTLALLQNRNLADEVGEKNGVLIHLFIDDHIPRLIGSRRLIKLWATNFPYYYLEGDSLKREGSFWTGRHFLTRFYRAVSQSAFIDLFDIDFPWYVNGGHVELFGEVLSESQKQFHQQFPDGKFLVVIGPNSKLAPAISQVLEEKGVPVLDLSQLLDKENPKYKIHWTEGHPNGNYYKEVATEISEYIDISALTQSD